MLFNMWQHFFQANKVPNMISSRPGIKLFLSILYENALYDLVAPPHTKMHS